MASTLRPKIRTSDHMCSWIPILLLVPKLLLHGIPVTATAQHHHAQYLENQKNPVQAKPQPPPPKKNSILYHIAILVHDELVMKSYMHVRLATVETRYHNLNANIKNQDYWLLTSSVGIKIQKTLNCSTGLKNTGLFPHILGTSSLQNGTKWKP